MTTEKGFRRNNRDFECIKCGAFDITVSHNLKKFQCSTCIFQAKQEAEIA